MRPEIQPTESEREKTVTLLREHGVPVDTWGQAATKTVDDLLGELQQGESELLVENGELVRKSRIAHVYVYCENPADGKIYLLKEDRQVFKKDGSERRRSIPSSLSEKMDTGEDPEKAALRALTEELQLSGDFSLSSRGSIQEESMSPSYPGLKSIYQIDAFAVTIPSDLYKPEGYQEDQPKKTTYFVWQEIPDKNA